MFLETDLSGFLSRLQDENTLLLEKIQTQNDQIIQELRSLNEKLSRQEKNQTFRYAIDNFSNSTKMDTFRCYDEDGYQHNLRDLVLWVLKSFLQGRGAAMEGYYIFDSRH